MPQENLIKIKKCATLYKVGSLYDWELLPLKIISEQDGGVI